jgi:Rab-like protein 2
MHPSYYFRAHACILVFDVTRKVTYQHLEGWYKELRQYSAHMPVIVVANKIDINYEVVKKEFQFATKRNLVNMFASAADGTNVVKIFSDAIEAAHQFKENPTDDFISEALEAVDYMDKQGTRTISALLLPIEPVPITFA